MVDKSITPLRTYFKQVFSSLGSPDRPSHPEVRLYPSSFAGQSPTCSQHDTATPSGFGGSQAETGDNE